jgi:hypothetical protein
MRTFGQQMLHLAEANYGMSSVATGKANPINGAISKNPVSTLQKPMSQKL